MVFNDRIELLNTRSHKERIQELFEDPNVVVFDTLEDQWNELLEIRELASKVDSEHVAVLNEDYGVWVYYPWSKRLVHLLEEDDFIEVRTNRNQLKITKEERDQLSQKKVGVIGLSVGQATAITLAIERCFGEIRLADFDLLELTNLNRIRSGVHNLGISKVEIVAREILEIDPFLKVICFNEGITDENIDPFLLNNGKLDVVIDECDSLDIKITCRLRARAHGIPVLMETSDRGMLDVERYDLHPNLSIMHGLVDHLDLNNLKSLKTNDEKVPYVMAMVGLHDASTRLKSSMLEINQTISTWPQLASDVCLGGAVVTNAWRRMATGDFKDSGRFYIDLDNLLRKDRKETQQDTAPNPSSNASKETCSLDHLSARISESASNKQPKQISLSETQVEQLISYANLAPSGGNEQPWKWVYKHDKLYLFLDKERSNTLLDFNSYAGYIALGACIETIRIASNHFEFEIQTDFFPIDGAAAAFSFFPKKHADASGIDYFPLLTKRETNRNVVPRIPIQKDALETISMHVSKDVAFDLKWISDTTEIDKVGNIVAGVERIRMMNQRSHSELMKEIRWTEEENLSTKDGIDLETLNLKVSDKVGIELIQDYSILEFLKRGQKGKGLEKMVKAQVTAAGAVGIITAPTLSKESFVQGGIALQKAWLEATRLGLCFQPVTPLTFLFARFMEGAMEAFDVYETAELAAYKKRFEDLLNLSESEHPIFLFRIFKGEQAVKKSLRRNVEDVFIYH